MEIIIKLIISFILFFILYKYIKNNYMIVFLSSIYMYKFYNLEISFSKVLIELGIIIILYKGLDYLINSNQIMNRIFNITDIEIIKEGKVDFKKLKLINMNFEDLLKKLNYINIEDIKSCTFDNNGNFINYSRGASKTTSIKIQDGVWNFVKVWANKGEKIVRVQIGSKQENLSGLLYTWLVYSDNSVGSTGLYIKNTGFLLKSVDGIGVNRSDNNAQANRNESRTEVTWT